MKNNNNIEVNQVYCFDILNTLNLRGNSTYTVQVLKMQNRLFRKPIYTVISLQNGNIFKCTGDVLTPVIEELDFHVYLRYPEDSPYIDAKDIKLIESIIKAIPENFNKEDPFYKDLNMLKHKLKFYSKVRDV